jgi:hypothetical protein
MVLPSTPEAATDGNCPLCRRSVDRGSTSSLAQNFDPALIASVRVRRFDGAETWKFIDE